MQLGERGHIERGIKGNRHGIGVPGIAAREGIHLVGPVDGTPHPHPDTQVDQLLHSGTVAGINGINGRTAILGRVGDVASDVLALLPVGKGVGEAVVSRLRRSAAGIGGLGLGLVPVHRALQNRAIPVLPGDRYHIGLIGAGIIGDPGDGDGAVGIFLGGAPVAAAGIAGIIAVRNGGILLSAADVIGGHVLGNGVGSLRHLPRYLGGILGIGDPGDGNGAVGVLLGFTPVAAAGIGGIIAVRNGGFLLSAADVIGRHVLGNGVGPLRHLPRHLGGIRPCILLPDRVDSLGGIGAAQLNADSVLVLINRIHHIAASARGPAQESMTCLGRVAHSEGVARLCRGTVGGLTKPAAAVIAVQGVGILVLPAGVENGVLRECRRLGIDLRAAVLLGIPAQETRGPIGGVWGNGLAAAGGNRLALLHNHGLGYCNAAPAAAVGIKGHGDGIRLLRLPDCGDCFGGVFFPHGDGGAILMGAGAVFPALEHEVLAYRHLAGHRKGIRARIRELRVRPDSGLTIRTGTAIVVIDQLIPGALAYHVVAAAASGAGAAGGETAAVLDVLRLQAKRSAGRIHGGGRRIFRNRAGIVARNRVGVVVELHGRRALGIEDLDGVGELHFRIGHKLAFQRPGVVPLRLRASRPRYAALVGPNDQFIVSDRREELLRAAELQGVRVVAVLLHRDVRQIGNQRQCLVHGVHQHQVVQGPLAVVFHLDGKGHPVLIRRLHGIGGIGFHILRHRLFDVQMAVGGCDRVLRRGAGMARIGVLRIDWVGGIIAGLHIRRVGDLAGLIVVHGKGPHDIDLRLAALADDAGDGLALGRLLTLAADKKRILVGDNIVRALVTGDGDLVQQSDFSVGVGLVLAVHQPGKGDAGRQGHAGGKVFLLQLSLGDALQLGILNGVDRGIVGILGIHLGQGIFLWILVLEPDLGVVLVLAFRGGHHGSGELHGCAGLQSEAVGIYIVLTGNRHGAGPGFQGIRNLQVLQLERALVGHLDGPGNRVAHCVAVGTVLSQLLGDLHVGLRLHGDGVALKVLVKISPCDNRRVVDRTGGGGHDVDGHLLAAVGGHLHIIPGYGAGVLVEFAAIGDRRLRIKHQLPVQPVGDGHLDARGDDVVQLDTVLECLADLDLGDLLLVGKTQGLLGDLDPFGMELLPNGVDGLGGVGLGDGHLGLLIRVLVVLGVVHPAVHGVGPARKDIAVFAGRDTRHRELHGLRAARLRVPRCGVLLKLAAVGVVDQDVVGLRGGDRHRIGVNGQVALVLAVLLHRLFAGIGGVQAGAVARLEIGGVDDRTLPRHIGEGPDHVVGL